jgi:ABC-type transport system involved in multi-copper enzyme maturation permease subunit
LTDNPLLIKELRIGLRERRIFLIQTLYLLVLSCVAFLFFVSLDQGGDFTRLAQQGSELFAWLVGIQAFMVVAITPSLTSGLISGEREKKSLDLLVTTCLSPAEIALGKLAYALAYVGLLLVSSLPVVATTFLLGGVSPGQVLAAYALLFLAALLAAQVGLFFSARESRTTYATNQAYGTLILLFFGSLVLNGLVAPEDIVYGALRIPGYVMPLFNAVCLALFLGLKITNHLAPRMGCIRWMGRLFVVWYLLDMAALALAVGSQPPADEDLPNLFMGLLALVLGLEGLFLNEARLPSQRERRLYRSSFVSRWWFWILVLFAGLALVGAFLQGAGAPQQPILSTLTLSLLLMVSFAVLSRGVFALFRGKVPFPAIYYPLLAAATVGPALPMLGGGERDVVSLLSGQPFSPLLAVGTLWSRKPLVDLGWQEVPLAGLSAAIYLGLLLMGALLLLVRRPGRAARAG